jgi:HrpA-like RNA helicase
VKDFTLEDVLTLTGYVPPKNGKKNGRSGRFNRPKKYSPWADSEHSDDDNDECIANPAKSAPKPSSLNPKSLPLPVEDLVKRVGNDVDYDLIAQLIHHLVERKEAKDDGSILVFLPGAPEINKAQESILRVTKGHGMRLLQLHGGLQPKDQQRVFESAPFGTTKVILSTNVAETR